MSENEKTPETEQAAAAAAEDTSTAEPAAAEDASETAADTEALAEETAEEAPAEDAAETDEPAAEEPAEAAAEAEEPAEAAASEEPAEEAPAEEASGEDASAEAPAEPAAPRVHTFDELKGMTVVQMREIAEGFGDHEALHGYTTMHKEELIVALCKAQGIEAHEHHEVVGIDKAAVKAKIRELKQQREALVAAGDRKQLKIVRRRIRGLKRKIHKATV